VVLHEVRVAVHSQCDGRAHAADRRGAVRRRARPSRPGAGEGRASSQLKDAKVEAASIIEQANRRAAQIIDEAKDRAREEGERIKVSAQAEIEQESNRAREQLRVQVGALAVAGASRILGRAVDENAHRDIVDQLAQEL
jgi:F-type H+-transporting ATPase subunit b